ncbi:putative peptidase [Hydrogenispora ethanolica]|uniref:Putative peptidase n=2 Tax=Hydrogenispora ethanolica TaxID=1082276 RepID=A0A4R1QUQ2_HYDET|nr:putative peptidase [Hydrogenispora ethanolica]
MRTMKRYCIVIGFFILVAVLASIGPRAFAQAASSVILITEVLPTGEVAAALAVEYGTAIEESGVAAATYTVNATVGDKTAARTITRVYPNDVPARDAKGKRGQYVIIEMDPKDAIAGTMTYDPQARLATRYALNYEVTQVKEIIAANGMKYPASAVKLKSGKERTPIVDDFKKLATKDNDGNTLNYRLFLPAAAEKDKRFPLVIFLHGVGERGADNALQLLGYQGALVWASPENQRKNPCYVAAPQCPPTGYWTDDTNYHLVLKMLDDIQHSYAIDFGRIYITGLSMGGFGTWKIIQNNPDVFAAAMPVCGGGDPANVAALKDMPIWAFHAADDPAVPVSGPLAIGPTRGMGSRDMVAALKAAGSTVVQYTQYEPGYVAPPLAPNAHFSWVPAYGNQAAIDWMFAQTKTAQYKSTLLQPGLWRIDDFRGGFGSASMYLVEGKDKALLIDTGMGTGDLAGYVRTLTKLPVEVVLTHGHPDHVGQANQFDKVYMAQKDVALFGLFGIKTDPARFVNIQAGDTIDLGGKAFEVIAIPGHTPGSIALLDAKDQLLATGDAIGSGSNVWMHIPGTLPLDQYWVSLRKLEAKLKGFKHLTYLVGHQWQEKTPITLQYVTDMRILVEKTLHGEVVAKPYPDGGDGMGVVAEYGSATLDYSLSNLWSAGKADKTKYQAVETLPGVIMIRDYSGDNMYFMKGTQKALLIDTGMGGGNLREYVGRLAGGLPVAVVLTHGHPDHVGQADQFHQVYLSRKDDAVAVSISNVDPSRYIDINEGDVMDLGGRALKVLSFPGHTPGSIVLLDETNRLLFTGDAVGTQSARGGLWLHLAGCPYIDEYLATLKTVRAKIDGKYDLLLTGHNQKAVAPQYLDYLQAAAQKLVDQGEAALVPSLRPTGLKMVVHGDDSDPNAASIIVNPEHLFSPQRK